MSEQKDNNPFDDIMQDPNIGMIVIGAVIWILGGFIPILGPLVVTAGFGITVIACAANAVDRPDEASLPGIIIGGILQIVGGYLAWVLPFLGQPIFVLGSVLLIFFGTSYAIKKGVAPLLDDLKGQAGMTRDSKTIDVEAEEVDSESEVSE